MDKKILFFLSIFSLFSIASADSISGYIVPKELPLENNLTIYGIYSGTPSVDVLCSFYIFDLSNTDVNRVVIRLNDQYTFSDGSFYAEYKITEPLFRRGMDYNAITKCGTTEIGQKFTITQKEEILFGISADSIKNDFAFFTNPDTSFTVVFSFFAIIFVAAIGAYIYTRIS